MAALLIVGAIIIVVWRVFLSGKGASVSSASIPAVPSPLDSASPGPNPPVVNVYYPTSGATASPTPTSNHVLPAPKHTPGMSDNFWVYTTGSKDTLASLTAKAGWAKYGTGYLAAYRNNAQVFASYGVDVNNPTAVLPSGMKISL